MKFKDMPYERPDLQKAADQAEKLASSIAQAKSGQDVTVAFDAYIAIDNDVSTAATLAGIRYTVDTRDAFYDGENTYLDQNTPILADKILGIYRAILQSPHKDALAKRYGQILLDRMEISVKSSDERLISLQQEENALATEYQKLYASARVPFEGGECTIAQLTPFKESPQRAIRKGAYEAEGGFFDSNREAFDTIYDKLVENRTKQARIMGYDTFTPLGDIRMGRNGYSRADITAYRNAVKKDIVPIAAELKKRQAQRIGVSDFKFYDDLLYFGDGNPTPKGTPEEILAAGHEMYRALSPETAEFIDFMMDNELFDVLSKPGKAPGGYCAYLPKYKSPFIYSNFNGTAGDVDVLTHEAGHAFAGYLAAKNDLPSELRLPGMESCEIHSMAMEYLTADYHPLFFKEDSAKYAISHAEKALYFMPYGCMVDEFQEIIYENPALTPAARNDVWLDLERKYRPWVDFGDLPFYARGGGWQHKMHIYSSPFYYIDYVLAQAISLLFKGAHHQNPKDAWQRYLALTEKAGTETYVGLVRAAGFPTPFEEGTMAKIGGDTLAWLDSREGSLR